MLPRLLMALSILLIGQASAGGQDALVRKEWSSIAPDQAQIEALRKRFARNTKGPAMREKAQALVDYTHTDAYQKKMDALIGQVFPKQAQARAARRATRERLYLFISSSMPMDVLRRYAKQAEGLPGAMMVLRGFVGGAGRIKPTVDFMSKVLLRDPGCHGARCRRIRTEVIVDPNLFRRYHIERVPAVVTVAGLQTDGSCSEGNSKVVKIAGKHVSFGDAPLLTHLSALAESGDAVAMTYVQQLDPEGTKDNGRY